MKPDDKKLYQKGNVISPNVNISDSGFYFWDSSLNYMFTECFI